MIVVEGLRCAYGERTVLSVDRWEVGEGEARLVIGPSGCGKSTLLHALAGVLRPQTGRVVIGGQDLTALSGAALDRFRGAQIGVIFQDIHLIPALTVRGNLALAAKLSKSAGALERIDPLLERLGLTHRANAKPRDLSRGEAQRAAIARALAPRPKVLLADEPSSALDDANAAALIALLKDEAKSVGATMVIATHDQRLRDVFEERLELSV